MRVAVVGAGLAGLAAARALVARGHEVAVFEKSRGLGGRIASRRAEGTVLDHGSPVVTAPPGSPLAELIEALAIDDRVAVGGGSAFAGGATRLPKAMAAGLDVRLGVRVAALREGREGIELGDEQGNTHGTVERVVVTAPAPQAADLLERSPEGGARVELLRTLAYAPAVMILAGVRLATAPGWMVRDDPPAPLGALRRELVTGRTAPEGIEPVVARLDAEASAELLDASDDAALRRALPALADALGAGAGDPAWAQVKRWRYAVPLGRLDADAVNPPGCRIVLAGDTLTGASFGGADHAAVYASGLAAARRVGA